MCLVPPKRAPSNPSTASPTSIGSEWQGGSRDSPLCSPRGRRCAAGNPKRHASSSPSYHLACASPQKSASGRWTPFLKRVYAPHCSGCSGCCSRNSAMATKYSSSDLGVDGFLFFVINDFDYGNLTAVVFIIFERFNLSRS